MAKRKKTFEEELEGDVKQIFEDNRREMGIDKISLQVEVAMEGWGPPVVGENVYAEAFPFENPPRIWMQVWPDATDKEIAKTVCHELIHIKRPELDEETVEKETNAHTSLRRVRAQ